MNSVSGTPPTTGNWNCRDAPLRSVRFRTAGHRVGLAHPELWTPRRRESPTQP